MLNEPYPIPKLIGLLSSTLSSPRMDDDYVSMAEDRAAVFVYWLHIRHLKPDLLESVSRWRYMPPVKRREYRQLAQELKHFEENGFARFPIVIKYYKLIMHADDQSPTYYRKVEERKMQFFLPETATWRESVFSDPEDYASQDGYGSMLQVDLVSLPKEVRALEGDCE